MILEILDGPWLVQNAKYKEIQAYAWDFEIEEAFVASSCWWVP